jgi:hypothetical protein
VRRVNNLTYKAMSLRNVVTLFGAIDERDDLRSRLNRCKSRGQLIHCLEQNQLSFSYEEFEEAINLMHVKCQTQEAANDLFVKVNWFRFLFYSLKMG